MSATSIGAIQVTIGLNIDDLNENLRIVKDQLGSLSTSLTTLGTSLSIGITAPIIAFGTAALETAGQVELIGTAFKTMLGGGQAAIDILDQLKVFALQTPFTFPGLLTASQHLTALGIAAKDLIPTMTAIGDATASLGGNQQTFDRIAHAIGVINETGKVTAVQIRELSMNGVPALQILADAFGITIPKAMELMKKGVIDSAMAVPALLAGMEEKSKGQMENMSKTFSGMASNIKDAMYFALADIGDSFLPVAKEIEQAIFDVLKDVQELAQTFKGMDSDVQLGFAGLLLVFAASGPLILGIGIFSKNLKEVISLVKLLAATEIGANLIAGLGSLSAAIGLVAQGFTSGGLNGAIIAFSTNILPSLASAAVIAGNAMGLLAAAWSGYQIGKMLDSVPIFHAIGAALANMIPDWLIKRIFDTGTQVSSTMDQVNGAITRATKALHDKGASDQEIMQAMQGTQQQQIKNLQELGQQYDIYTQGQTKSAAEQLKAAIAQQAAAAASAAALKAHNNAIKEFVADSQKLLQDIPQTMDELQVALSNGFSVKGEIDGITNLIEFSKRLGTLPASFTPIIAKLNETRDVMKGFLQQEDMTKAIQAFAKMDAVYGSTIDAMGKDTDAYIVSMRAAVTATNNAVGQFDPNKAYELMANAYKGAEAAQKKLDKVLDDSYEHMMKTWSKELPTPKFNLGLILQQESELGKEADDLQARMAALDQEGAKGSPLWQDYAATLKNVQSQMQVTGFAALKAVNDIMTADKAVGVASIQDLEIAVQKAQKYVEILAPITGNLQAQLAANLLLEQSEENLARTRGESTLVYEQNMTKIRTQQALLHDQTDGLSDVYKKFMGAISSAWDGVGKGLADAIVSGQNFGKVMTDVFNTFKKAVVEIAVQYLLGQLKNAILANIDATGALGQAVSGLGKVFNAIFGAAPNASLGDAVTSSAKQASSIGSLTSGLMGSLSMITSIVSSISGIIGNFQMARMEKTLNAIEEGTRTTAITIQGPNGVMDTLRLIDTAVTGLRSDFDAWLQAGWNSLIDLQEAILQAIRAGGTGGGGGDGGGSISEQSVKDIATLQDEITMLKEALNNASTNLTEGSANMASWQNLANANQATAYYATTLNTSAMDENTTAVAEVKDSTDQLATTVDATGQKIQAATTTLTTSVSTAAAAIANVGASMTIASDNSISGLEAQIKALQDLLPTSAFQAQMQQQINQLQVQLAQTKNPYGDPYSNPNAGPAGTAIVGDGSTWFTSGGTMNLNVTVTGQDAKATADTMVSAWRAAGVNI